MKKSVLLFCLLSTIISAWSQVTMTLQVPPSGIMLKPQLWNIMLMNTGLSKEIEIGLVLTDKSNGEVVLTGTTNMIALENGTKQVTSNEVNVNYDYPSILIGDHDPDGYLAVGSFDACYTVYDVSSSHQLEVLDECTGVSVEPVSPPLLMLPDNESSIEGNLPFFTWLPPAPINLFSNLNYELKLVEVLPGQASSEAIQQNMPLVLDDGNTSAFFSYPSSATTLDTSKIYAWQVVAKNYNSYASQSDIWTFRLVENTPADTMTIENGRYIMYKSADVLKGIHIMLNDTLSIKYNSMVTDTATLQFMNANDEIVYTQPQPLVNGDNLITVPLPALFRKYEIYSFRLLYADIVTTKMYFTEQ